MINFNIEKIVPVCEAFGLTLDNTAISRLNTYGNMLVEWNEKMNLTAITEPEEVLYKHFLDCLMFFKNVDVPKNAKIIDVGTGAGFPGMVLKIARPDIELTLMDGLNKRLTFLNAVLNELKLTAKTVHMRAEDGGKNKDYREKYDIVILNQAKEYVSMQEYDKVILNDKVVQIDPKLTKKERSLAWFAGFMLGFMCGLYLWDIFFVYNI